MARRTYVDHAMYGRTTISFYHRQLRDALRNEQPWLQSEKLPEYLPFYVGRDLLESLRNNTNHLVVGRRGTGKTHLLGAFAESVTQQPNKREIAVFLQGNDFAVTPPQIVDESLQFSRAKYSRQMFQLFLSLFAERFIDAVGAYLESQIYPNRSKQARQQLETQIDDLLIQLLDEVEIGSFASGKSKLTSQNLERVKTKRGAEIAMKATKNGPSLSAGASTTTGNESESQLLIESEGSFHVNLQRVRSLVLSILDRCQLQVLYLLIDEWMQLDKNLHLGIQPYFAELLKQVFFNHKRFSVKIASVWHKTDLYDRLELDKSKGLELGEDITLGADLDTQFLTKEDDVVSFFTKLLFRRLQWQVPDLNALKDAEDAISHRFIVELFDKHEHFNTLIIASHGVPRDFMELFHKCSLRIRTDFEESCISSTLIRESAKAVYLVEKRKTLEKSSDSQRLWDSINVYMARMRTRVFIVHNVQAKSSTALRKLVDEELIHPIPSASMPREARDHFKAFQIDYGTFVDWTDSIRDGNYAPMQESVIPTFPVDFTTNMSGYTIEVAVFGDDIIRCPKCGETFSAKEPVYNKLKACKYCGEIVLGEAFK